MRGLIFDFDGLIVETESPIFQSWQEVYQDHNLELPFELWATIIGRADGGFDPLDHLEEQIEKEIDRAELLRKQRSRESELIVRQPILPGVEETIRSAQRLGLKLGVASSSSCEWVTGHLSRLGLLEHFNCIRGSDDVERTKPDPTVYLLTLECLGLQAEEAFAIEDSPNGVTAAKRAGLFCVAVPNPLTRNLSLEHADLILDSLAEVPLEKLLERIDQKLKPE